MAEKNDKAFCNSFHARIRCIHMYSRLIYQFDEGGYEWSEMFVAHFYLTPGWFDNLHRPESNICSSANCKTFCESTNHLSGWTNALAELISNGSGAALESHKECASRSRRCSRVSVSSSRVTTRTLLGSSSWRRYRLDQTWQWVRDSEHAFWDRQVWVFERSSLYLLLLPLLNKTGACVVWHVRPRHAVQFMYSCKAFSFWWSDGRFSKKRRWTW